MYMPEQWSRGKLKELTENLTKFKEAIKLGDTADNKMEERK